MNDRDGTDAENGNGTGGSIRTRISASRPVRVVGVIDHPVTPMPAVSCVLSMREVNETPNFMRACTFDSAKQ